MTALFARVVIAARVPIIVGWVAAGVAMALSLPTLREAQTGALGQLVPADSRALEAEKLSASAFRFPLASRTTVVERDDDGLDASRVEAAARLIADVNRQLVPEIPAEGAYGVANSIPGLAFARDRGTTTLSSLLFELDRNQHERVAGARQYVAALDAPPESFVGITGAIPARAKQAEAIEETLPVIELATVALIASIVAIYLRSLLAPFVTLITVALAYVVSVRFVAGVGESAGPASPATSVG